MISVNDIIEEQGTNTKYRVLWLSDDGTFTYVISLMDDSLPIPMPLPELLQQLDDGSFLLHQNDEWLNLLPENEISEQDRAFRDVLWEKLQCLLAPENEPAIFDSKVRGPLVHDVVITEGISKKTLYKHIKRFWQRGKTKNALLPETSNAGGKGTKKKSTCKLGRPRKYGGPAGKYVDTATEQIFAAAVKHHYHTKAKHTFKAAYEAMLKESYSVEVEDAAGKKRLELLPADEIPTLNQFRYWYHKHYSVVQTNTSRQGERLFNLKGRAVTGKSDTDIMGPGAQFQIDATVGDIYLVSQFNRADIIGRPILYFIIDAFSRMVAGVYVGLEGPSWAGAMMALANAASDKVGFCAEYGIDITEEEWPCHHIPDAILGDRGEMESKSVETLINSLGVRIENTPPYRADMKGIVEQYFHTVDTTVTAFLPGHVKPDMRERLGRDYRLDAKLDLYQFTKIIIECILYHNNEHSLDSFGRSEAMIRDDIPPIPIKLWEWGIANRSGLLRTFPEDVVKLCLMPAGKASVTARGIRFKGIHYLCDLAIREKWFEQARAKGSFRVDVSYDPRNMAHIYLRGVSDAPYEVCYLADWQEKYDGKYLDEIVYLHESEKMTKQQLSGRTLEARVNLSAKVDEIISEAERQASQTELPKSKAQRTKDIRGNRARDKEMLRREEAFVLTDEDAPPAPELPPDTAKDDDEDLLYLDLIRRNAEERRHD